MANAVDRDFVRLMIPHHRQGVQMGELAAERGSNPDVKQMAEHMIEDQRDEIAELEQLLGSVGLSPADLEPEESKSAAMRAMLDHLAQMSGQMFDRSFVSMMMNHHLGAIQVAELERAGGELDQLVEMASTTREKQVGELDQLRGLLTAASGGE